ncbi:MAG: molybdopterin synthase catalytic subunit MoaE [Parahaliea sp.]
MISIQEQDFDLGQEYQALREAADGDGAIVTFSGLVRDMSSQGRVSAIFLEHYPGMTEKALMSICLQARERWPLGAVRIIHRIGRLDAAEQIVFVGVTSQHRRAAFEAAEYLMDILKTRAPLWKKELTGSEQTWVDSKASDQTAANRW